MIGLKPRMLTAHIPLANVIPSPEAPGQESASKGTVGYEADAQLPTDRQDFLRHVPGPK